MRINKFLQLIENSGLCDFINSLNDKDSSKGGRPSYNQYNLIALILYSFTFNKLSLRDIEESCYFDLRMIYIMDNEYPSHMTISNFINDYIVPHRDKIFSLITNEIFKECNLDMGTVFIDGSKFEANANKYKFVWKPTKFHENLRNKIYDLLKQYKLSRDIKSSNEIDSKVVANKLIEFKKVLNDVDISIKENKHYSKAYNLLSEFLKKILEYEEKERICGPDRNSYYKTDHDATGMCLKQDYYSGLGSNLHAAYNTQLMVSNGLIATYLVTQSRSDTKDFIETVKKYYQMYQRYPKIICADAGYGSKENYTFMYNNNIDNYVKHKSWEGNISGRNPTSYVLNNDHTITCLNGNIGYKSNNKTSNSSYMVENCQNCLFEKYCKRYLNEENKQKNNRIFSVDEEFQIQIQETQEKLLSPKGIELRVNRSAQVEGVFGIIKQDLKYTRFQRKSIEKVATEFMLICIGYNLRKVFSYFDGKGKFKYWSAPEDLKSEKIKKPSAKRLTNKVINKKNKSKNEESKKNYKYK